MPLQNGSNDGLPAGGTAEEYSVPKDATNSTGDGKAGAGQDKSYPWFRKNSESGAGEGRSNSGSEEQRAGDVDAAKAKQQQQQHQQHQQTDTQRAQSCMSACGGDVTAEQDEGGGGRKRQSSGSEKMGGFFKLFGKRDSWERGRPALTCHDNTDDDVLHSRWRRWLNYFSTGSPDDSLVQFQSRTYW
jgi:hypothetical protein